MGVAADRVRRIPVIQNISPVLLCSGILQRRAGDGPRPLQVAPQRNAECGRHLQVRYIHQRRSQGVLEWFEMAISVKATYSTPPDAIKNFPAISTIDWRRTSGFVRVGEPLLSPSKRPRGTTARGSTPAGFCYAFNSASGYQDGNCPCQMRIITSVVDRGTRKGSWTHGFGSEDEAKVSATNQEIRVWACRRKCLATIDEQKRSHRTAVRRDSK